MLFTSVEFLILFLPTVAFLFYVCKEFGVNHLLVPLLIVSSFIFYMSWDWHNVFVLTFSLLSNYVLGKKLARCPSRAILGLGIFINLSVLGYFKYSGFFVNNLISLGADFQFQAPVLPLAISFFTFQLIAYLVDVNRKIIKQPSIQEFLIFVLFFPQLVAGPIVHFQTVQQQFSLLSKGQFQPQVVVGLSYILVGLVKKIYLADPLGNYVDPIFALANTSTIIDPALSLVGYLGYTFQLYFDFSAYGDIAIGLGLLFGVKLPVNFNSPYKSTSIVDFWRRWHITLGNFLRDYLYIPLGGSHKGDLRKYLNLFITMLLGGLWHGAAWTFVIWGILHGLMLICNHLLNKLWSFLNLRGNKAIREAGIILTFAGVSLAWVIFRADSVDAALSIYKGLLELNTLSLGSLQHIKFENNIDFYSVFVLLFQCTLIVFFFPNSHSLVNALKNSITPFNKAIAKSCLHPVFAVFWGGCFFIAAQFLWLMPSAEFLYFNF